MNGMLQIHARLDELPHGWNIDRAVQIYDPEPGLVDHLELATGQLFIATGERLVRASRLPAQLEKKAI